MTDTERAGVFLTNALTGWEPTVQKPLPFPELEEERDRAGRVKQDTPILVILGNPPYNGFAGMAVDEERELSTAYRNDVTVRRPEGQGLNDLYVRFFRMAERRIAQKTGRGVVCFISNYSWLDGLSFTGMRERYLWKRSTQFESTISTATSTRPARRRLTASPTRASSPRRGPVGIQVGTAIATTLYASRPHVDESGRLPPSLGSGQARGVDDDGRGRDRHALRSLRTDLAARSAFRTNGGQRRLVRLAVAA